MNKMNNLGVKIKINRVQICKAGFDNKNFVLTPMVTLVHRKDGSEEFTLYVGGFDPETAQHLNWHNVYISPKDVITMEIIEGPFDPPTERKPAVESLESKLERYYALKEELKEHIER